MKLRLSQSTYQQIIPIVIFNLLITTLVSYLNTLKRYSIFSSDCIGNQNMKEQVSV